jgi:ABC-type sugar transport system substrate-binding protein
MKRLLAILMCALLILGSFAVASAETKTYKIAGLMKQNADTFVQKISDAMTARATELGAEVELLMQDAEGDINKQLEQAEAMKTMGVDAVILNAVDVEGSAPIVDMFIDAGIPVIECNTLTNNSDKATCYVGSDDVDAVKIQADFLKTVLPEAAKVCYMMGPIGVSPQIYRKQGIEENLFNGSKIEVLQEQTANWKRAEALALAENWLTTYQELDAIICQNDDMAMGALEAVEAAGRKDKVIVIGIDAIEDAKQAVKDGRLDCTVFQDAAGQGAKSVDVALECAKAGTTEHDDVIIPFQLVTKDNVDQFM